MMKTNIQEVLEKAILIIGGYKMKEDFSVDELLKMWKLVKKEYEEILHKPGANGFTKKEYEELLHKLECNLNHEMKNK